MDSITKALKELEKAVKDSETVKSVKVTITLTKPPKQNPKSPNK